MSAIDFSPARVVAIAGNTLREAVRQRVFIFLVLIALALIAGSRSLGEFNFGSSELKFIADFGLGAITFFGSILAIVTAAQLFFSEIENRTALTLLAKPVLRAEFVLGKFLGVLAVLTAFVAVLTVSLAGVLWWREGQLRALDPDAFARGGIVSYAGLFAHAGLQWLKFGVLAALTMLIATFSNTNLFTVVVAFLALLICHLQYLAHDAWQRLGAGPARVAAIAVSWLFPNFQVFNLGEQITAGAALSAAAWWTIASYGALYLAAYLLGAVLCFRTREI